MGVTSSLICAQVELGTILLVEVNVKCCVLPILAKVLVKLTQGVRIWIQPEQDDEGHFQRRVHRGVDSPDENSCLRPSRPSSTSSLGSHLTKIHLKRFNTEKQVTN